LPIHRGEVRRRDPYRDDEAVCRVHKHDTGDRAVEGLYAVEDDRRRLCRAGQRLVAKTPLELGHEVTQLIVRKEASRLGESELAVTTDNDMHDPVFPNGCAACGVEVAPATGFAE